MIWMPKLSTTLPAAGPAIRTASSPGIRHRISVGEMGCGSPGGRAARSASAGSTTRMYRNRSTATVATIANSRSQRVSSTSSLRMFWTVLNPMSGRNSPNAISAVSAPSRSARTTRRGGAEAAAGISHLFHVGPAEDPLRQENHHDGKDREGGDILVGERDVFAPQGFDDADQEAAQHRAGERADAAEHRRRERLYAGREAVIETHHAIVGEVQ